MHTGCSVDGSDRVKTELPEETDGSATDDGNAVSNDLESSKSTAVKGEKKKKRSAKLQY